MFIYSRIKTWRAKAEGTQCHAQTMMRIKADKTVKEKPSMCRLLPTQMLFWRNCARPKPQRLENPKNLFWRVIRKLVLGYWSRLMNEKICKTPTTTQFELLWSSIFVNFFVSTFWTVLFVCKLCFVTCLRIGFYQNKKRSDPGKTCHARTMMHSKPIKIST